MDSSHFQDTMAAFLIVSVSFTESVIFILVNFLMLILIFVFITVQITTTTSNTSLESARRPFKLSIIGKPQRR